MGIKALRSRKVDGIEARLTEKGYSKKAIKEIIKWYKD